MAVSDDYLAFIVEQLGPLGRIRSRRMFGGVGLYAGDLFFAVMDDDSLYFKTNDSNRLDYEARGAKPFCPFPDKPEMSMNYHAVPAELLDDAEELCHWARRSVAIALASARKPASVKPRAKQKAKQASPRVVRAKTSPKSKVKAKGTAASKLQSPSKSKSKSTSSRQPRKQRPAR